MNDHSKACSFEIEKEKRRRRRRRRRRKETNIPILDITPIITNTLFPAPFSR
jgi:hypothetical protein